MSPLPVPPSNVSTDKQSRVEELLRKSLLGDNIIDTQFYLFSARSSSSDRVIKPRALCANNHLLTSGSKYFSKLLNSTTLASGAPAEITGDGQQVLSEIPIDDYGYASDSDLEDDFPGETQKAPRRISHLPQNVESVSKDGDELSKDGPNLVISDVFILDAEEDQKIDEAGLGSREAVVKSPKHATVSVGLVGPGVHTSQSRRILVKDTAFRTWYALLYYLYTGEIAFSPLKSACAPLSSSLGAPKCSAKSMYRLANKVGLEELRNEALKFLRSNITEQNVLKELTSSLVPKHAPLLETELDMLYSYIDSGPVIDGLPHLAKCIANNELPHGADIFTGIHQRLLKAHHPSAWEKSLAQETIAPPCSCKGVLEEKQGFGSGKNISETVSQHSMVANGSQWSGPVRTNDGPLMKVKRHIK